MHHTNKKRILFVGHSYYHAWYLSRELRKLGWKADVLNIDKNIKNKELGCNFTVILYFVLFI